MSLLGIIVVGMITFGAWCMVGIASLIIQVWLFTFHDYAAWLGARRIADGTIEFNENVIVAAVLHCFGRATYFGWLERRYRRLRFPYGKFSIVLSPFKIKISFIKTCFFCC